MYKPDDLRSSPSTTERGEGKRLTKVPSDPGMRGVALWHTHTHTHMPCTHNCAIITNKHDMKKLSWFFLKHRALQGNTRCYMRKKTYTQIHRSDYERKPHISVSRDLAHMKRMIFSPFQALLTHCLTQKSAVEEETAALNRASLYSLGQQQYPEVQFRGAKQGRLCGWSLTVPWEDSALDPGDGETFSDGNKRKMPCLY